MGDLEGKVAVVTGAASGIGAVSAKRFAEEGASVVVADLSGEAGAAVAEEIRTAGGSAVAVAFDLGDADSVRQLMDEAAQAFGGIDVLFNNAAATQLADTVDKPIAEADADVWDDTMRINVRGTMLCIRHGVPHLLERGRGAIVNTASTSGMTGDLGRPAYAASKAAIIRLTTYAAAEYGKRGIRCNAISPGLIMTPNVANWTAGPMHDLMLRHYFTPRLGQPEDIANAAIFLASDKSAFITGQVLKVDGGLLSHMPYLADVIDHTAGDWKPPIATGAAHLDVE